jgi:hypothetical protein
MNAKDAILGAMSMGEMVTERYLADLSDADLLVRPVEGQNHIAWQLGHLLVSERGMVESVKPGSSPELPTGFAAVYDRDEASTGSNDPSRFLSKEKYLGLMKAQREATRKALAALTDAELDAPGPERFQRMCPTVGSLLLLVGTHQLMHVGQWVSVRRKLGKPVAI